MPRLRRLGVSALLGILLLCAGIAAQDRTARPSLADFDPDRMGRLEASMWRSYYEHRWAALVGDGLRVSCGEHGFSWWDGWRSSFFAARAALHFRSDTGDPRCLPLLERYYSIVAEEIGREFDVAEAARLELEWWRERRRKLAPEDYARTIAANASLLYGLPAEALLPASLKRAEAMHYRDRHGGEMMEAHWTRVAEMLGEAYAELRRSL